MKLPLLTTEELVKKMQEGRQKKLLHIDLFDGFHIYRDGIPCWEVRNKKGKNVSGYHSTLSGALRGFMEEDCRMHGDYVSLIEFLKAYSDVRSKHEERYAEILKAVEAFISKETDD